MNTIKKTNDLYPGMSIGEFKKVMGDPDSTQMINGAFVYKYSLQKLWVGYIPHYFYFDPETKKLITWNENMAEYRHNQALLNQATSQFQKSYQQNFGNQSNSNSGNGNMECKHERNYKGEITKTICSKK